MDLTVPVAVGVITVGRVGIWRGTVAVEAAVAAEPMVVVITVAIMGTWQGIAIVTAVVAVAAVVVVGSAITVVDEGTGRGSAPVDVVAVVLGGLGVAVVLGGLGVAVVEAEETTATTVGRKGTLRENDPTRQRQLRTLTYEKKSN